MMMRECTHLCNLVKLSSEGPEGGKEGSLGRIPCFWLPPELHTARGNKKSERGRKVLAYDLENAAKRQDCKMGVRFEGMAVLDL